VVLERIKKALEDAGCSLKDVVKNTIWLQDPRDFNGYNKVYAEFFPHNPPARATVRADLMVEARIEIDSIAYSPENK
jgi:enamine deaminase RidA (YjgF/YER057c/UK114 family)